MSKLNRRKLWAIIGREFNVRVRKRSFIVTTFLVPILLVGIISLTLYLTMSSVATERVAIIDATDSYASLFEDTSDYTFFASDKPLKAYQQEGKNNSDEATIIVEITEDLRQNPAAVTMYAYGEIPIRFSTHIEQVLSDYVTDQKLEATGIENLKEVVDSCKVSISIPSYKWDKSGKSQRSSGLIAGFIGMFLAIISFTYVANYGALVMAGVLEEKKNRIMEVMVSSVRPIDLMRGKIIGIAFVGLFQLLLWAILLLALFFILSTVAFGSLYDLGSMASMAQSDLSSGMMMGIDSSDFQSMQDTLAILAGINIPLLVVAFLLYFIGGYLLYSALYAAIGASISNDEDANQFITPIMIILMFAFYTGMGSMSNPNGAVAVWSSIIPFTSPVSMLVRIPAGVPIWQLITSVVLLYATAFLLTWLSAKIYRVGILMYGKKPSLKEIWRWIYYK